MGLESLKNSTYATNTLVRTLELETLRSIINKTRVRTGTISELRKYNDTVILHTEILKNRQSTQQ